MKSLAIRNSYSLDCVENYPILSAEEEFSLANKLRLENCAESAKKLFLSHINFVRFIVSKYPSMGLRRDDLIQEGCIGLLLAIKSFDPSKGFRLSTYAVHWIKNQINDYILRNWSIVKIATTKAQRKLFFNLRKMIGNKERVTNQDYEYIAGELNVNADEARSMHLRLTNQDVSIYAEDDDSAGVIDFVADASPGPDSCIETMETERLSEELSHALSSLDERSRDIIYSRWIDEDGKTTLKDLSEKYGVSIERIRQLENKALEKLKGMIKR